MSSNSEPASSCWEVERHSCGTMTRPCCVVILRSKKEVGKSIVAATSSDFESMNQHANRLSEDLFALSNDEFTEKYGIVNAS